ncbi:hypothetical protein FB45DRAFT_1037063 [Roridomyces roridus]|uniref:Uncharacterized protein n=1 Tax=Roridomyces roridus TaxID=1738132 RepID=A0AAD7B7D1_9AGAR|nr:hypothetical protein FB45DRAFT_1037063 [Roridomyces roridus]
MIAAWGKHERENRERGGGSDGEGGEESDEPEDARPKKKRRVTNDGEEGEEEPEEEEPVVVKSKKRSVVGDKRCREDDEEEQEPEPVAKKKKKASGVGKKHSEVLEPEVVVSRPVPRPAHKGAPNTGIRRRGPPGVRNIVPPANRTYLVDVIQVIQEVGAIWLLPNAFYVLSAWLSELRSREEITRLSTETQMAFFRGHEAQVLSTIVHISKFLSDDIGEDCTDVVACAKARLAAMSAMQESNEENLCIPLDTWDVQAWRPLEDELCDACLPVLKKTYRAARQALWNRLPEMYGLPPWEDLRKMKLDAIGNSWLL